jgi:hypothetical protein
MTLSNDQRPITPQFVALMILLLTNISSSKYSQDFGSVASIYFGIEPLAW